MGYGKIISENVVFDDVALVAGLEANLLRVRKFAEKGLNKKTGEVALKGARKGSLFVADFDSTNKDGVYCFYTEASEEVNKLWHKNLSHLNFKEINTLSKRSWGRKRIFRYLKETPNLGLWYPKGTDFEAVGYTDADFAGCRVDRKSTSGSCQFLGQTLVSWYSKKQQSVSTSTAEAEYIAAGSCCAQVLWIRNQLMDYGLVLHKIPIMCDNTSAISIVANPVNHSRTKQIDVRYHFIREHCTNGTIELIFVPTEKQLADIFTKPLDEATFTRLVGEIGMLNSSSKGKNSANVLQQINLQ
ncbi:hypothetical protein AgCh_013333 [Apium graveolens]